MTGKPDEIIEFLITCLDNLERDFKPLTQQYREQGDNYMGNEYVLRDIDCKRRVADRHRPFETRLGKNRHLVSIIVCSRCVDESGKHVPWPCDDMKDAAAPFADRVGYKKDWKPFL